MDFCNFKYFQGLNQNICGIFLEIQETENWDMIKINILQYHFS